MSYTLHAWVAPLPKSLDEAIAVRSRLAALPAGASERLSTFVDRLLARHACPTTLPAGSDNDVWTSGPMRVAEPGPLYSFGIRTQDLGRVLPFVIETARALGIVVLDEQAAVAYLPNGTALTPAGRSRVETPAPAADTTSPPSLAALPPAALPSGSHYRLYVFMKWMVHKGDCERHIEWAAGKDALEWKAFADAHHYGHAYHDHELRGVNIDFRRFQRFARQLNRRLRSGDGAGLTWSDPRELDESTPRLVYPLDVRAADIATVRPLVFEEASCQGLVVFDPQARLQADCTGTYSIDDTYVGVTDSGDASTYHVDHARAVMEQALTPMLAAYGYDAVHVPYLRYVRRHDGIEHEIWPNMSNARAHVGVTVRIRVQHADLAALHARWPVDDSDRPLTCSLHAPLMHFGDVSTFDRLAYDARQNQFELHRDRHFLVLAEWCADVLRAEVEPLLAQCRTVESLAATINTPTRMLAAQFAGAMPETSRVEAALVAAQLADTDRFDAVREAAEAALAGWREAPGHIPASWLEQIRNTIDQVVAFRARHTG